MHFVGLKFNLQRTRQKLLKEKSLSISNQYFSLKIDYLRELLQNQDNKIK